MRYKINFEMELRKNPYPGVYIALEGTEACGKSTQAKLLGEYFSSLGREVVVTREPRKTGVIGDLVHKVLLGEEKLSPLAFQYLFTADRADHHEKLIEPSLKAGKVVISDRCFWSAIVYGILDKTGGQYDKKYADLLLLTQSILSMYHQFIIPDYTFYLKIPFETSIQRLPQKQKGEKAEVYETSEQIKKTIAGYDFVAEEFASEIITIDGSRSIEDVTKDMISQIKEK